MQPFQLSENRSASRNSKNSSFEEDDDAKSSIINGDGIDKVSLPFSFFVCHQILVLGRMIFV